MFQHTRPGGLSIRLGVGAAPTPFSPHPLGEFTRIRPLSTSRSSFVFLAAVLGLALAVPLAATNLNGFMPGQGHGNLALSYTAESYDHFWVGDMEFSDPGVGEVETDSLSTWFQWGFTDNLALVVDAA